MKKRNYDISEICKITGLCQEEVEKPINNNWPQKPTFEPFAKRLHNRSFPSKYLADSTKSNIFAPTNPTTLLVARPADQGGTFLLYMEYTKQPLTGSTVSIPRTLLFRTSNLF